MTPFSLLRVTWLSGMKSGRAAWWVWASSLVLLMCTLSASRTSFAQTPQQTALARTLFEEGVQLADRGDWVGASDRFGRAHSLKPTAGIAFNWARALAETGKLLHARELLLAVERDDAADPQLRKEANAMLATLDPRIARLRIVTTGEPDGPVRVEVDGEEWPRAAWGVASPIDPGPHTIVSSEDGEERTRTEIELQQGERRDLPLRFGNEELVASSDAHGREGAARKPLYRSWILWSAVGLVVAGGVVTAIVLANRGSSDEATPIAGNTTPGVIRW
jgi:hypothetical protein